MSWFNTIGCWLTSSSRYFLMLITNKDTAMEHHFQSIGLKPVVRWTRIRHWRISCSCALVIRCFDEGENGLLTLQCWLDKILFTNAENDFSIRHVGKAQCFVKECYRSEWKSEKFTVATAHFVRVGGWLATSKSTWGCSKWKWGRRGGTKTNENDKNWSLECHIYDLHLAAFYSTNLMHYILSLSDLIPSSLLIAFLH